MKLQSSVWIVVFAAVASCAIAQDELQIPVLTATSPKVSAIYEVSDKRVESRKFRDSANDGKRAQYTYMVSHHQISQEAADEFLKNLDSSPLEEQHSYKIGFAFDNGKCFVEKLSESGILMAWSLIENGHAIYYGWAGGDSINLSNASEPYSIASAQVPILPVQVPGTKVFVDIESDPQDLNLKMIAASTCSDQFLPAKFSVANGRLANASIPKIETWNYDNYEAQGVALPHTINYSSLYDADGKPQVMRTYTMTSAKLEVPTLDDLIKGDTVEVVDYRTDPNREFTYTKGKGSIIEQSKQGIARVNPRSIDYTLSTSVSPGTVLVGIGFVMLIGLGVRQIFVGRRA